MRILIDMNLSPEWEDALRSGDRSKVILRHTNLSTTQRCLGKVTDTETIRWIDNLYS